ncbi:MAG TPA: hypothetical protein VGL94_15075 [Ktedonobacteraceae bacterium]
MERLSNASDQGHQRHKKPRFDSTKEASKKNLEQSRRNLKREIERTRTLYHWIIKFQKKFGLEDEWVQKSLQQTLEISTENLKERFTEFLRSPLLTPEIRKGPAISDIVDGDLRTKRPAYDTSKIVEDFESFRKLNAEVRLVHESLKDGISVETRPRLINGLRAIPTSGDQNNCLIHALLKVSDPDRENIDIESLSQLIRDQLKERMEERKEKEQTKIGAKADDAFDEKEMLSLKERCKEVNRGKILDLSEIDGYELIDILRELKFIKSNRGIQIYKLDQEKISCFEQVPHTDPDTEPYTLFLYHDFHFEAMIPEKDTVERRKIIAPEAARDTEISKEYGRIESEHSAEKSREGKRKASYAEDAVSEEYSSDTEKHQSKKLKTSAEKSGEGERKATDTSSPEKGTREIFEGIATRIVDKREKIQEIISQAGPSGVPIEDKSEFTKLMIMFDHLYTLKASETNVNQLIEYNIRIKEWHDYFYKTYKKCKKGIEKPKFLSFEEEDYVLFTKDTKADYLALDGSKASTQEASSRHYAISSKTISSAEMHPEIEEVWYCLSGHCTLWRKGQEHEDEVPISPEVGFKIPPETSFQLCNTSSEPAGFFITTKPLRPGDDAWQRVPWKRVPDHWEISSSGDSTYHGEAAHGDASQTRSKIIDMHKEISVIFKKEQPEEILEKFSAISNLVRETLNLDASKLTDAASLDRYYQQITKLYNDVRKHTGPIYKEAFTQTPEHDLKELLPKDRKKVNRFFAELPWPRRVEKADTPPPAIILVTHLFTHHIPFLYAVKDRGPLKMIIPKTASSDQDTIRYFQYHNLHKKLGKKVLHPDDMNDKNKVFPVVDFGTDGRKVTENPQDIATRIREVLEPGQSVIILDHGAYFKNIDAIQRELGDDHRIIGISEATLNGEIEYRKQQEKRLLSKPVISISSKVKHADDIMIGDSIVRATERILAPSNVNIKDQQTLVIGYGTVGSAIAENLRKEKVTIYDTSSDRQMHATQHYKTVNEPTDRDKALMESEIIFCATGNQSLKKEDYPKLRKGCFVVLGTSGDIEIEAVSEDQYKYSPEGDNIHKYESKTEKNHYFYILGPKRGEYIGAVNFSNLQPAVGHDIYNVLAMEVAGFCQIQNDMFTEQKPGVQKIGEFYEDIAAKTWLWYYTNNKSDPEEILRQRHRIRKDIDDDTYQEISTALEQSRKLQKKYGVNRPTLSLPRLEPLRQSYAEGKFDTATFNEIHQRLKASIKSEQKILRKGPSVDTTALKPLRQSYAEGKFDTATFDEIHQRLKASIGSEQKFLSEGPRVPTFALVVLRNSYTRAQIEAATLDKIQQEAKLKLNTVDFDEKHEKLVASIKSEQEILRKDRSVNTTALARLRYYYAHERFDIDTFDEKHEKLVASIDMEKLLSEALSSKVRSEDLRLVIQRLAILRHEYAEGKFGTDTFNKRHMKLATSIKSEREILSEDPDVNIGALTILWDCYAEGKFDDIPTFDFDERHQKLEASIKREQKFLRKYSSANTTALALLRQSYAEGKLNTAAFDERLPVLVVSINKEKEILREDPDVDRSALASLAYLRYIYVVGGYGIDDPDEFKESHEKLEIAFKYAKDHRSNEKLSIILDLQKIALVQLKEEEIDLGSFNQMIAVIHSQIEKVLIQVGQQNAGEREKSEESKKRRREDTETEAARKKLKRRTRWNR